MNDAAEPLQNFAAFGKLYRAHFMGPNWRRCQGWEDCPWDGIGLFLWSYAFERQGRRPDFSPAALHVVRELKEEGFEIDQPKAASEAWCRFSKELGDQRLNPASSPMAPKGTRYLRRSTTLVTTQPSAIQVAGQLRQSIVTHVLDLLRTGETKSAHAMVASINGVGAKIASLFLRDVGSYYGLSAITDRYLLQPIDTWIRRAAQLCLNVSDQNSPEHVGRAIVEACQACGISPEEANEGMWYFGAIIAQSEYGLRQAIGDSGRFHTIAREYVSALRDVVAAYAVGGAGSSSAAP